MKQKLRRLALGVLFGMLALCALSLQAGAAETAFTDQALEGISLPKVLGAETFSWDCDTTPVKVTGYKPTAHMELDSTKVPQAKMEKLLNILYGTANTTPYLPLPDEVIKLMTT